MRGRGRPPLARNVYSFEDLTLDLPTEVVLDTSFVANALISTEAHHQACRDFFARLAENNTTIYYNRLLDLELAETAFKIAVIERHGRKAWPAKRHDGRVRARAARLSSDLLTYWATLLDTVPHVCIELHEVADAVPGWMTRYGLGSMDAAHAATANYVAADGLVTTDAGFGAVESVELRLYVDNTRVRSRRRRRGGS